MEGNNRDYLSIPEVASLTGLSRSGIRYWCSHGVLEKQGVPVRKVIGRWRIDASRFHDWWNGLTH